MEDEWEQREETNDCAPDSIPELAVPCTLASQNAGNADQSQVQQATESEGEPERPNPDWTIARIGKALRQGPSGYTWSLEADETRYTIKFPEPARPYDHTPGSHTRVNGRGKVATGIDCSPILVEAIKWWMAGVRWSDHWANRPDNRRSHEYTVSYLEMVVDIEASTGINIPEKGWHQKALKLASIMRNIARIYTVQIGDVTSTWKDVMDPKPDLPPLTPLNAPRISGLSRRPRWMCGSTTEVVAANIWRSGLSSGGEAPGCNSRAGRTFLSDQVISRTGVRQVVVWRTRAEKELKIRYDTALKDYYNARDRWQANLSGPPPLPPSLEASAMTKGIVDTNNGNTAEEGTRCTSRVSSAPPSATSSGHHHTSLPRVHSSPLLEDNRKIIHNVINQSAAEVIAPSHRPPPGRVDDRSQPIRSLANHPCSPPLSQNGAGASSSSGLTAVPIVATSLRELRELQAAQLAINLAKKNHDLRCTTGTCSLAKSTPK